MLISTLWTSKFPTRWYYYYWWVWSSILKILRVTSLQYLYNISKKKFKNGVNFLHADKHQSFYKLALSFLMNLARHVQSTKNRKLVIFLRYIQKKVWQRLLCSIIMHNIQIFYGSPVIFVVTCFWVVVVKNGPSLLDHATLESAIYISIMNWWKELIFCSMLIQV